MTGPFTILTESAITDRTLTGEEFRLMALLLLFDLPDSSAGGTRKGFVFVARSKLAAKLGRDPQRITHLLERLERKGYVRRELQKGRPSQIHLTPPPSWGLPRPLTETIKTTLVEKHQDSVPTLDEKRQGGLTETVKGVLMKSDTTHCKLAVSDVSNIRQSRHNTDGLVGNPKRKNNSLRIEIKKSNGEPSAAGPKKPRNKRVKKEQSCHDPEVLRKLLDMIDLSSLRSKWEQKGIDVTAVWEDFQDVILSGTATDTRANPYGYTNFAKALTNWCKRRHEKQQAQRPPDPTPPSHRRLDL